MKTRLPIILTVLLSTASYAHASDEVQIDNSRFDWGGFYLGAQVGLSDHEATLGFGLSGLGEGDDVIGGVHLGYNFVYDNLIIGPEFTALFGEQVSSRSFSGLGATFTQKAVVDDMYLVNLRLGLANENWLLTLTGGLATAEIKSEQNGTGMGFFLSGSDRHTGYNIGASLEYSLSESVSVGLDYKYIDLDEENHFLGTGLSPATIDFTTHIIGARISIHTN